MKQLSQILGIVSILLLPNMASACMGAMGYAGSGLGDLLVVSFVVFLAGYLPYVVAAIKLASEAKRPLGVNKTTRVVAIIFAVINTTVYTLVSIMLLSVAPEAILVVLFDTLLWGLPFMFFMKGMKGKPLSEGHADLLDA